MATHWSFTRLAHYLCKFSKGSLTSPRNSDWQILASLASPSKSDWRMLLSLASLEDFRKGPFWQIRLLGKNGYLLHLLNLRASSHCLFLLLERKKVRKRARGKKEREKESF